MTTTAPRRTDAPKSEPGPPLRLRIEKRRRRPGGQRGWFYAAPLAAFVVLLFILPLLLVGQMSLSDWPLLGGNRGINAPANFVDAVQNRFFIDALIFTLQYTAIATVLLLGLGLGLALIVQESSRWKNLLRTAFLLPSRSASPPRRSSSTSSTRRSPDPSRGSRSRSASPSSARPPRRSGRRCSSSSGASPASTCCS